MQRIRIKKAPKLGDQVDYSFYDNRAKNAGGVGSVQESETKNTMGPVPREEASIEVERGEVVVGDTNNDGFLELFTFTGKPHSKGGTPVDVPPGSFIYSNTRKLRIKDAEVLDKMFGLKVKKGGYTPAEIAKNYQINQYVDDLKSADTDNITKRSADKMLQNNVQKLGVLALIQESMKGFPDGIPAIAESAALALGMDPAMMQPQQEMQGPPQPEGQPMDPQMQQAPMKMGGLKKYQKAGQVGDKFYINGQENGIKERYKGFFGDEWVKLNQPIKMIDEDDNETTMDEMTVDDFNKLTSMGSINMGWMDNAIAPSRFTNIDNLSWWNQDRSIFDTGRGNKANKLTFSTEPNQPQENTPAQLLSGYEYNVGNKRYRVLDSNVYSSYGSENGDRRAVRVQQIKDNDQNFSSFFDTKFGQELIPLSQYQAMVGLALSDPAAAPGTNPAKEGILNPGAGAVNPNAGNPQTPPAQGGQSDTRSLEDKALAMGWGSVDEYKNSGWKANEPVRNQLLQNAQAMGWGDDIIGYKNSGWVRNPAAAQQVAPAQRSSAPRQSTPARPASSGKIPSPQRQRLTADDFEFGGSMPYYMTTFEYGGAYAKDGLPIHQTKGPVQEEAIGPGKKPGTYKYKQPNGDIYLRQEGTGKVLGIQHTDGSISTYYNDRVERNDKAGKLIGVDVPEASQAWNDLDWKGEYMDDAAQFEKIWADPKSAKLQDAMYEEFKKIAAVSPNSKELLAMSKEDALKYLLEGNRQNAKIQSAYQGNDEFLKSSYWDKANVNNYTDAQGNQVSGKNLYYNQTAKKLGLNPLTEVQGQAFQAMYQAAQRMARQPEYMEQFKDFDINPVGLNDQQTMGEAVSPVEGWYGNTTAGQLTRLKEKPPEPPEKIPEPGKKLAYYCVESQDGSRAVQSVEYADGQEPVAPTGTKVTKYDNPEAAEANCGKDVQPLEQAPPKKGPWWAQDILNFTAALTDDVDKARPVRRNVDLLTTEWNNVNDDAAVASAQSQQKMMGDMAANSVDGNTALASMYGVSGDMFDKLAQTIGNTNNVNAQTGTQAGQFNVGIENQERMLNQQLNRQNDVDIAVADQNYENANRKIKQNRLAAFTNGLTNYARKLQQEEVITPQVFVDPITFHTSFSGKGRDVFGPDVYQNSFGYGRGTSRNSGSNQAQNSNMAINTYDKAYTDLLPKYGEQRAHELAKMEADRVSKMMLTGAGGSGYGNSIYPDYGNNEWATGGAVITPDELFYRLLNAKNK